MRSAAQGVLATLHRIFEIGLHALRLTPAIGTVLAALDGTELNVLLRGHAHRGRGRRDTGATGRTGHMGVDEFQGGDFVRPLPVDDGLDLLRRSRGRAPRCRCWRARVDRPTGCRWSDVIPAPCAACYREIAKLPRWPFRPGRLP